MGNLRRSTHSRSHHQQFARNEIFVADSVNATLQKFVRR